MPKFQNLSTWQQAEQLMQPAFIRLVDNIRKQLDQTSWKGSYEEVLVWAEGTSDEVKAQVLHLREQLGNASAEAAAEIERRLAQLPSPYPGYLLSLKQAGREVTVDLWEMCYRICFQNYDVLSGTSRTAMQPDLEGVEVDTSLFDEDGEVDWNRLDDKTQQIVEQVFASLPI